MRIVPPSGHHVPVTIANDSRVYYDPYDAGISADPFPTFRRLRDEAPIYYNERYDVWALSRHADVEKAVGLSVAHTFPSDYRIALQALNKGRPLSLDNHNDLSGSFRKFAHKLSGTRPEREIAQPGSLFGRLTNRK